MARILCPQMHPKLAQITRNSSRVPARFFVARIADVAVAKTLKRRCDESVTKVPIRMLGPTQGARHLMVD